MVRHECAEALGSIATPECKRLVQKYVIDKEVHFFILKIYFFDKLYLIKIVNCKKFFFNF